MGLSDTTLATMQEFVTKGFGWQKKPTLNSQKAYWNHIQQFESYLHTQSKTASDGSVTDKDLQAYVTHMQGKFSPNTMACRVGVIKSYFGWLKRQGKLTHTPEIQSLKHMPAKRTAVTTADIDELLKHMPPTKLRYVRDAAMIMLMAYRGLSPAEVINLNVEDLNFNKGVLRHRNQLQHMKHTHDALLRYAQAKLKLGLGKKGDEPFFLNKFGNRISSRSLRRHFNNYLEAASLKGKFSTRDLYLSKSTSVQKVPELVSAG